VVVAEWPPAIAEVVAAAVPRTWEVEFIDNSRVTGVAKPTVRLNEYFQVGQKAGGLSFWRGIDRVGVTGYG
jgi:hypothetical protein